MPAPNSLRGPRDLTDGPVGRGLAWLTLPMLGGLFATMAFNVTDTWFVSRLGTRQLAAMSFTFPVVMVLTSLGIGLGAGSSSVLARAVGSAERRRIVRLATDSLVLTALLSVAASILGLLTLEPLFRLLGADAETLPLVRDYMEIWYPSLALLLLLMVGGALMRATGDTVVPGALMIVAAGLNLVLDPLLIFGLLGLPRLELRGAALASLVARGTMVMVTLLVLRYRDRLLSLRPPGLSEVLRSWREILSIALPAAATNMIIPAAIGVVTAMLATFGPQAVAAFGAASRVESMALILFYALSATIGPFVGQNFGAGKTARVEEAVRVASRFCLLFGFGLAVSLALLRYPIARLFSDRQDVVDVAASYLLIVPISYGAYGLVMITNAVFNALGLPLRAVFISVLRMLVFYLPLAWIGSRIWGVPGIFVGGGLGNLLAGLVAYRMGRHLPEASTGGENEAQAVPT